ncbi:hypothetical protein DFS34DRAFT_607705 [Phlyctochytrium arcticum]|nr:hypothetical protein DFS34DRAFT_607705 [Phlyctochytrium arcticum]
MAARLTIKLAARREEQAQNALVWGPRGLFETASQILLFVAGKPPRRGHRTHVSSLVGKGSKNLKTVVDTINATTTESSVQVTEASLAATLDNVMAGFTLISLYTDRSQVEVSAVKVARDLLGRHPRLRTICHDQLLVIDHYEQIMTAFGLL